MTLPLGGCENALSARAALAPVQPAPPANTASNHAFMLNGPNLPFGSTGPQVVPAPIRVLVLDDQADNLLLRAAVLRKNGYAAETASTIEEAEHLLDRIDIAVLDYHLGAGRFGTDVAAQLRRRRPQVPIIILSATLERRFGGVEDMHLLKGYSSSDDLIAALRSFEARLRGAPVVVDARDFYYSRITMALGEGIALAILDATGNWHYVNEVFAQLLEHERNWFPGRNMFCELPELAPDWRDILKTIASTRETYIDRTQRGMFNLSRHGAGWVWSVLAFPITLHTRETGVALTARMLERRSQL